MKDLFKKTLKAGVLWFAAGALFALAANFAAPFLGAGAIAGLASQVNPVWLGSTIGGASAIAVVVEPLLQSVFGENNAADATTTKGKEAHKQVNITIVQSPQQSQAQMVSETQSNYRQTIAAEKLALLSTDTGIGTTT